MTTLPATLPVWSGPAFATTALGCTTTFTVLANDVLPFVPEPVIGLCVSVTTRENVNVWGTSGEVNVGLGVRRRSTTSPGSPAVWVQAYESACAWAWVDAVPFNVTGSPTSTC